MFGIEATTGSHLPILEEAAKSATGLVVEHGAGLYSTPLLARLGCRVLCCEPHAGWREWAAWIYQNRAEMVESWEAVTHRLPEASVAFIDGPALERGPLLSACIAASVATIIVHDTEVGDRSSYGLTARHFSPPGYTVTTDARRNTTVWRR
jgi:hypothetical protein